jgi:hypothetical protein
MHTLPKFTTIFGLCLTLLVAGPTTAIAQRATPSLPNTPPDTQLTVNAQSGTCPKTVGLWTSFRYYEGGGEHTVIADTLAVAGPAQLVTKGKKLAEYTAPLKAAYASCVGQASSQEYPYRFQFSNGNISFRVELPADTPANPSEINVQSLVSSRPYVRWAIAD